MIRHTYCKYSYDEQMKAIEVVNDMLQTFICEDENDSSYCLESIKVDENYRFTHSVEWIGDDKKERFEDFMKGKNND